MFGYVNVYLICIGYLFIVKMFVCLYKTMNDLFDVISMFNNWPVMAHENLLCVV